MNDNSTPDTSTEAVNALISDLSHDYADDLERRASDMVRALAAERDRQYDENATQIMEVAALEAEVQRLRDENADLKGSVIAFCAPWAVKYARDFGFPERHLHPTHYDILEKAGARMVDFTRADLTPPAPQEPKACGGCGESDPSKRCLGCLHDFGTKESAWVNAHQSAQEPRT